MPMSKSALGKSGIKHDGMFMTDANFNKSPSGASSIYIRKYYYKFLIFTLL